MHIFYKGLDGEVYGPETECKVQRWYLKGHFSSDIKFQISTSDQVNPDGQFYSLGELVDMNGRALPFYFSSERENRETMLAEKISRLEQEVESLRTANESNQDTDFTAEKQMIVVLKSQVASLLESHAELLSGRQTPSASPELEKNLSELKKKIGEQEKALASMKKSNTELLDKVSTLTGRQKESATASQQLEKSVSELKKKIGEQEKALSSMKKELSAANSKCDRCDSKLEKSIEKQNVMEESVIGHDRRMTDLSDSMKSIRAALTSVEEKMANNKKSNDPPKSITANVAPWEGKVLKSRPNAAAKVKDRSPWDDQEIIRLCKLIEAETPAPVPMQLSDTENDPDEPWNQPSGRTGGAPWEDGSSVAVSGRSTDQNPMKPVAATSSKKAVSVNSLSQAKNWDAICRDQLSEED